MNNLAKNNNFDISDNNLDHNNLVNYFENDDENMDIQNDISMTTDNNLIADQNNATNGFCYFNN